MKLHEVLSIPEVRSGEKWIRPRSWTGPHGYCVKDGDVYFVPSARGGQIGITSDVEVLSGEWDVLSPSEILES